MAEIRKTVMERADGRCELYGCGALATEAHHVVSGSGKRRAFEDSSTVVACCSFHHRQLHRNDSDALVALLRWAEVRGSLKAMAEIERRQSKIEEAKRA